MKRRICSLLLTVAVVFSLGMPLLSTRSEAAESVYFTAVNEQLCPLNDETMPFWSGGNLYVPSTVFSSYDLDVSYVRDTSAQTAILYTSQRVLEFDLVGGGANNKTGTYYSASAVSRNGYIYFPLAFVCNYFRLSYSVVDTAWVPMVRVRDSSSGLSDRQFLDAASSLMSSRYRAYLQSKQPTVPPTPDPDTNNANTNTDVPGNETQPPENGDEETENRTEAQVLLGIRAGDDNVVSDMLDTLDQYQYKATFFFDPASLEGREDLLRRIVASGHRIGLVQPSDGDTAALEEGNDQLRRCTGTVTRLVLSSTAKSAQEAGYAVYQPDFSAESVASSSSSRANRILSRIEGSTGTIGVLLGGDSVSAAALRIVCSTLAEQEGSVRAVNETACT